MESKKVDLRDYSVLGAVAVFFIGLGLCGAYFAQPNRQTLSKLDGLNADHGDFRLQVEGNEVYVFVKTQGPHARIKALSDALELLEKESGKKVMYMTNAGTMAGTAVFRLEEVKPENPEVGK